MAEIDRDEPVNQSPKPKTWYGKLFNKASGFVGKYIGKPISAVKSGIGTASKWIWKNKAPIMNIGGTALQVTGAATGQPELYIAGKGLVKAAGALQEGEAKNALIKAIGDRKPSVYGNLLYSDMSHIHYSKKPAGYKIYVNKLKDKWLSENISNLRSGFKSADEKKILSKLFQNKTKSKKGKR